MTLKRKNTMRKVKVIKSEMNISYDDCYASSIFYPAAGDWEEVSDSGYKELQEAVSYANRASGNGRYFLIEYSDNINEEVFKSASDFKSKMLKQRQKEEKAKEEAKRKRDEKALERKRKQLEKLKKELEEG
jgi:hypothetical protein